MEAVLEQYEMRVVVGSGGTDDTPLPGYHYDDTLDDCPARTKHCWIPAEPGSKFCIHYGWDGKTKPAQNATLVCDLYIDELHIVSSILALVTIDNRSGKNRESEIEGVFYNGPAGPVERPFMFKETSIVPDVDADILDTPNKGSIRVVLYWESPDHDGRGLYTGRPNLSKEEADNIIQGLETPVSSGNERFRSQVGFGDPVKIEQVNVKYDQIDNKKYTFIFHYAHPDWLKSEGIIAPKVSSTYRTQANKRLSLRSSSRKHPTARSGNSKRPTPRRRNKHSPK
ncbi:unnamed protein product [Rhizoctonia solani]|uniref:DUF7918 domain-containing protein n=1 Tax=Rhizoctonia solani TaxID=456999 RepID=A0A8H3BMH1_9AGAM|nr:unnamed protein product [Rhizoctonia solani]